MYSEQVVIRGSLKKKNSKRLSYWSSWDNEGEDFNVVFLTEPMLKEIENVKSCRSCTRVPRPAYKHKQIGLLVRPRKITSGYGRK